MFIEIPLTQDILNKAEQEMRKHPPTNKTWMSNDSRLSGFIGQEIFKLIYPAAIESKGSNVYNYDFLVNSKKVELKTKGVNVSPKPFHECSIYTYNNQLADVLVFASILRKDGKFHTGYLLGAISKEEFENKKFLVAKGVRQSNGMVPKVDTWNIKVKDLHSLEIL